VFGVPLDELLVREGRLTLGIPKIVEETVRHISSHGTQTARKRCVVCRVPCAVCRALTQCCFLFFFCFFFALTQGLHKRAFFGYLAITCN
jgi:hypothetical protein